MSNANEFETTTNFIINHIRRTYNKGKDIADVLEKEAMPNFKAVKPRLQKSTADKPEDWDLEDEEFKMEYKIDMEEHKKRIKVFEENFDKAFGLLWEQCSKTIKSRVESRTNFGSSIKGNPILLIQAIREFSLSFQSNKFEMAIVHDAIKNFVHMKQKQNESLLDYITRFCDRNKERKD